MKLTKEECGKLSKKLEFNFKSKNPKIVEKLSTSKDIELSEEDRQLYYSKLESRFKKSDDPLVVKLKG